MYEDNDDVHSFLPGNDDDAISVYHDTRKYEDYEGGLIRPGSSIEVGNQTESDYRLVMHMTEQ